MQSIKHNKHNNKSATIHTSITKCNSNKHNNLCVVMNITINRTGVDKILYREWTTLSHDNVTSHRRLIFTYNHNVVDRSLLRTPVVNLRWHQNCIKPSDTIYNPGCTQGVSSSRLILVTRSYVLFSSLHRSSRCSLHFLFFKNLF